MEPTMGRNATPGFCITAAADTDEDDLVRQRGSHDDVFSRASNAVTAFEDLSIRGGLG